MTKAGEREIIKAEHAYGGAGYITKEMLISDEDRGEACKMYAKVTVPAGCEIGYHVHQGDGEDYFILSGQATLDDNHERELILNPGDHFFTPSSRGHSITNNGKEDLVFMALIIYDEQKK